MAHLVITSNSRREGQGSNPSRRLHYLSGEEAYMPSKNRALK
jgi:hypothetical protein